MATILNTLVYYNLDITQKGRVHLIVIYYILIKFSYINPIQGSSFDYSLSNIRTEYLLIWLDERAGHFKSPGNPKFII